MEYMNDYSAESVRLAGVVQGVRNRWRLKRALRGASIVLAVGFVVLAIAALALDALRYGDTAVTIFRIGSALVLVALTVWFIVLPLLPSRAPDDRRVALYLEEHEPSLDASLVTAVELGTGAASHGKAGAPTPPRSSALIGRLVQTALERVRRIDDGRHVDERELHLTAGILALVAAAALVATALAPSTLRHGFRLLLTPWDSAQPLSLYAIAVEPGNVTVARGGDLLLTARLRGFESDEVDLLLRQRDSTSWSRVPMSLDSTGRYAGRYAFRLFDVKSPMEYVVESNGIRSPAYRIDVADLPYTKKLGLDYRFPAYTGLPAQSDEDGGDVAAPRGTQVRVRVTSTVPTRAGRLIVDRGDAGSDTVALAPLANGTLAGVLRIQGPGFYRVELQAADGRMLPASLDYTIDVLPDRPPTVSIEKPGRDIKVLSVDEVYAEARAEDDYGVQRLDLVYSVNGGTEQTVHLYDAGGNRTPKMSASHTFELEDFKLQPGDVVSYYARATDNDAVNGPKTATSDIYFLQVRPYAQEYQQDQSGGGGGGGQSEDAGQFSQRQREIIAATFNTARDRASTQPKQLQENLATLRLSQQRLREQVEELGRKLVDRGIAARDSNFAQIAQILPRAAAEMDSAEHELAGGDPQKALQPEQRALQQLQHAEAVFRNVRVSMGGGGGGGGASQSQAQDLADLFELNRDKLRNQYESVQRGREQQQQSDQAIDGTIERLKQLAARQQQENERALRKADSLAQRMGASGSSGGSGQRELAQQAEETARQLERLARDREQQQQREAAGSQQSSSSQSSASGQSSGEGGAQSQQEASAMRDAARRLRDAANAMRRSASESASPERAAAEGAAALRQLQEAQSLLDRERSGRLSRDVDQALRSARALGEQEQQVASELNKLLENGQTDPQRAQHAQSLMQQKGDMANEVRDLKRQLDRMALDSRRDNPDASRGLEQTAGAMRDRKLEEKIRASQGVMRSADAEYSKGLEGSIGDDIADLQKRLEQVATTAREGKGGENDRRAEALQKARQLVEDLSALDERMRAQAGSQSRNGQSAGQPSGQQSAGQRSSARQRSSAPGQQPGQASSSSGQQGQGQSSASSGQPSPDGRGGGGQSGRYAGSQGGPPGSGSPPGAISRELRERLSDAQSLRKQLAGEGVPLSELDRAIGGLRNLAQESVNGDDQAAAALRAQTLEQLQAFEFSLRRAFGAPSDDRVLLGRSGDVPPAFRQYVEEYYRALARTRKP